jgi:hypothetical protein
MLTDETLARLVNGCQTVTFCNFTNSITECVMSCCCMPQRMAETELNEQIAIVVCV